MEGIIYSKGCLVLRKNNSNEKIKTNKRNSPGWGPWRLRRRKRLRGPESLVGAEEVHHEPAWVRLRKDPPGPGGGTNGGERIAVRFKTVSACASHAQSWWLQRH